ncbi:3'-5' exonuclease [Candidatus Woesearchaeota archaeon]|nr:3'-5' exonuclease [Candidatus Woesearchaeota archaeon]
MRSSSYVVLDVETTGLRPGRHGLTEVYAARVDGHGNVEEDFHSLVNPGHPVPTFITRLTGIDDEMVEDAPEPREAVRAFDRFLRKDDVLVGHNLRFDLSFLGHERLRLFERPFPQQPLCTLKLSRRVFAPEPFPSYRLGVLAERLGIPLEGAHRARADVMATVALKQELFKRMENVGFSDREDALNLQSLPLRQAASLFTPRTGRE